MEISTLRGHAARFAEVTGDEPAFEVIAACAIAICANLDETADRLDLLIAERDVLRSQLATGLRVCLHCGSAATCFGRYEGHGDVAFGCDTCCGHGNEDGWCKPIDEAPEDPIAAQLRQDRDQKVEDDLDTAAAYLKKAGQALSRIRSAPRMRADLCDRSHTIRAIAQASYMAVREIEHNHMRLTAGEMEAAAERYRQSLADAEAP